MAEPTLQVEIRRRRMTLAHRDRIAFFKQQDAPQPGGACRKDRNRQICLARFQSLQGGLRAAPGLKHDVDARRSRRQVLQERRGDDRGGVIRKHDPDDLAQVFQRNVRRLHGPFDTGKRVF